MSFHSRMSRTFQNALLLPLAPSSRYILFSDCHRGCGNANDNFLKNDMLYLAALRYYFDRDFAYLELGDGDELWENRSMKKIKSVHESAFAMLTKFCQAGRCHMLYGNHDMVKKRGRFFRKHMHSYKPLKAGIILKDALHKKDVYLTHGHQISFFNSTCWRLARFLVRYLWRPLESLGIPDPTSAAKNNTHKRYAEVRLTAWAKKENCLLITGHTHHPMIGSKDSPYCNTGACTHPSGITAIEIENRCMTLVKWHIGTRQDFTLYAAREVLGDTVCIDYF